MAIYRKGYDPKCEELARYFLGESAVTDLSAALALHIQESIEEWLSEVAAEIRESLNADLS